MISILLSLLVLAMGLWILAMILDMLIPAMGMPPQVKPIVLALVGLMAIISFLGGHRIPF